jgi:hypothetical protein
MRFSAFDVIEIERRVAMGKKIKPIESSGAHDGLESELHTKIEDDLKRRRWYYVRSRMDKKSTQQKGVPDFIVAAPEKFDRVSTYWIEVKRNGSKLTPEQNVTKHVLQALGHKWACVYSFEEYLRAIEECPVDKEKPI